MTETVRGGQVFPPEKIRSNIVQQATSIANGTETTIITAAEKNYHDVIMIIGHNDSDAAVTLDIRDATAGTVRMKLTVPAASAKVWQFDPSYKQTTMGDTWTADMPDTTNTTINLYVQAVKIKQY